MYVNGTMSHVETIPVIGDGGKKENDAGGLIQV
jgi:hypothetical protein